MRPSAALPSLACCLTPVASTLMYAHVLPSASGRHFHGVGPPSTLPSSSRSPSRLPAASVVRCTVDSDRRSPASSGSTFRAASSKESVSNPARLAARSAPGVKRCVVRPTSWSHGNDPPQRWQK